jgi:hypothetical protein
MRHVNQWVVVLAVAVAGGTTAHAAIADAPASAPAPAPASVPSSSGTGLAVVALAGGADAAWPLARSVYGDPSLRPTAVDEAHARVLCGEPASATAPAELHDLADTVAALRGDDAPSRALLASIARRFAVRALVVVRAGDPHATAQLFLAETGAFDAALYAPDEAPPGSTPAWSAWSQTTRSLDREFGAPPAPPAPMAAPAMATREAPKSEAPAPPQPFYRSVWFWGALGAAALAGGAAYFATRDSSPSTIHLEVQVPH